MSPTDPKQLLQARLEAYKRSLEKATDKQKLEYLSVSTGRQYNQLRNETANLYPAVANAVPPESELAFGDSNYCDRYLDLQINIEQLLSLINAAAD